MEKKLKKGKKVTVLGAGNVGASIAFALAILASFISSDALRKLTVIFCFVKTDNDATFKNSRRHLICSFVFLGRSGNPKFSLKYVY